MSAFVGHLTVLMVTWPYTEDVIVRNRYQRVG
jgi:hypothetical protein